VPVLSAHPDFPWGSNYKLCHRDWDTLLANPKITITLRLLLILYNIMGIIKNDSLACHFLATTLCLIMTRVNEHKA
jgi:hypothetical protein